MKDETQAVGLRKNVLDTGESVRDPASIVRFKIGPVVDRVDPNVIQQKASGNILFMGRVADPTAA